MLRAYAETLPRLSVALEGRSHVEQELGDGVAKACLAELAAVLGAERFVQEITSTARLQHPHILPLFDSGTADGFLFYVMPYIEGENAR